MINAGVIQNLKPFIVTSWHGHRNDRQIPPAIAEVWQEKFSRGRGGPAPKQSNVDIAVIDSRGKLVHWFDAMPRGPRGSMAQYTARELAKAADLLGLRKARTNNRTVKSSELNLPDLKDSRGIRVTVTLKDDRMIAYQAPVVEAVSLPELDWKVLQWPSQPRTLNAEQFKPWLSQVYPPGVMERTNPRTKMVYQIKKVEGQLSLEPAGVDNQQRYAILSGKVQLTDEGTPRFSYQGQLEIVITYKRDDPTVKTLRGFFEGIYPRYDRMHNRTRRLPLEAVFESLPE